MHGDDTSQKLTNSINRTATGTESITPAPATQSVSYPLLFNFILCLCANFRVFSRSTAQTLKLFHASKYFKNTFLELIISFLIFPVFNVLCLLQPAEISPPAPMPPNIEKIKLEGNEMFKKGQYSEAKDLYTKAIEKLLPSMSSMLCFNVP